jgi:zinc transport system ATP-binding protein
MPMTDTLLRLDGVNVELGGRPILRGIDLTVRAGEVVTLLGANGSGKSTLVRAVLGLVPVSRGEVQLFGVPRERFRDWHRIGFVPQRSGATSGVPATVTEVVTAGRLSRRRAFLPLRRADREIVRDAIEAVGLSAKAGDGCSTLSGGQQQRALIARALAAQPDLLVLDEPTAGVDAMSQQAIADTLARLTGRGATMVVVLHEVGPFAPSSVTTSPARTVRSMPRRIGRPPSSTLTPSRRRSVSVIGIRSRLRARRGSRASGRGSPGRRSRR